MQCHIHLERSVGERKLLLLKGLAKTSSFVKCLFFGFVGGWEERVSSFKILCVS